jgi:c-di-GMP-binding flagellar brake protein YcgR
VERRKRKRFVETNEVIIESSSPPSNSRKIKAWTYDLSTGGARVLTMQRIEPGTLLKLRIDLASTGQSITLDGEVRWLSFDEEAALFELGVEFHRLTSRKILCLIRHLYGQNGRVPSSAE